MMGKRRGAPAADSSNNLYLITGNATFDATNATAPNNDYGDSFLKLTSGLSVTQYFYSFGSGER